jgi:hypothetical protein
MIGLGSQASISGGQEAQRIMVAIGRVLPAAHPDSGHFGVRLLSGSATG